MVLSSFLPAQLKARRRQLGPPRGHPSTTSGLKEIQVRQSCTPDPVSGRDSTCTTAVNGRFPISLRQKRPCTRFFGRPSLTAINGFRSRDGETGVSDELGVSARPLVDEVTPFGDGFS